MSKYLIIESRDPFESPDVRQLYALAGELGKDGHEVTVYLIQNGVLAVRSGAQTHGLTELIAGGKIKVLADDYSLNERGIQEGGMTSGVAVSTMDTLVDLLVEGGPKVIWH